MARWHMKKNIVLIEKHIIDKEVNTVQNYFVIKWKESQLISINKTYFKTPQTIM